MKPDEHPKVAIVSSDEIAEQGGILDASYWVGRQPGESWQAWTVRLKVEHLEELAEWHEQQAAARRAEAGELKRAASLPKEGGQGSRVTG